MKALKHKIALALGPIACAVGFSGCTGEYAGQNLPSGYYLTQQIQYYPPGPQFKLSREAAAQKAYRDSQVGEQIAVPPPVPPVQQIPAPPAPQP
jgi:hypothetical protein